MRTHLITKEWQKILSFFLLYLISLLFQQSRYLTDAYIIGNYLGKDQFAAVSASTVLLRTPVNFAVSFAMGVTIVLSQALGRSDTKVARNLASVSILLAVIFGVTITSLYYIFAPALIRWAQIPSEIQEVSLMYFKLYLLGTVFTLVLNFCIGVLYAYADARNPLRLVILSFALNLALDLLLVKVFNAGTAGAAIATVLSEAATCYLAFQICKNKQLFVTKNIAIFDFFPQIRQITFTGLPIALQALLFTICNVILQRAINVLGIDAITAWSICNKLDTPVWLILDAVSITLMAYGARYYGAQNRRKFFKLYLYVGLICFIVIMMIAIALYMYSYKLGELFVDAPYAIQTVSTLMRFFALFYVPYAVAELIASAIRSCGNTIFPFSAVFLQCALRLAGLYVLGGDSISQIANYYCISWIVYLVIMLAGTPYLIKKLRGLEYA